MNLYRIAQSFNNDDDTYDSAVVIAPSTEDARLMHPKGDFCRWHVDGWYVCIGAPRYPDRTWAPPEHVLVELIGTALPDSRPEVVLASFNAG